MMTEAQVEKRYAQLGEQLAEKGIDIEAAKTQLMAFRVELPSWVFGAFGGGRFGAYMPPGAARNVFEKIDDAVTAAHLTGGVDRVALHAGWDKPDEVAFEDISIDHFKGVAEYCAEKGIGIGAVNPTLFLAGTHYGSFSSPDAGTRECLVKHSVTCGEIAARYADNLVTYWLPDGSNYPGQIDLAEAEMRVRDCLVEIYNSAPDTVQHLVEYKLFEPGTFSTTIPDAGVAKDLAADMGDRAGVLVDMGHHAFAVNIAQIVARLIRRRIRGGFHFNSRYAADDDHSVEPGLRMFEIFCELVAGKVVNGDAAWAYMIDQCSGLENRVHAVLHSVDSLQISLARALIVDRAALAERQADNDIIRANRVLLDAFNTDVRSLVAQARLEKGGAADPVEAYVASGYQEKINEERMS
ncbi:L-rhamnose isomerase [Planctomycetota bacterium]